MFGEYNVQMGIEWNRMVLGSRPSGTNAPRPYDRPLVPHVLY